MKSATTLRIANCSGFFGDRLVAAREMIDDGPIDVLTGDWLAELTMGVLARQRQKDTARGYARTFVTQLDDVLADCLDRGIKIVSNAGGLNPSGCAAAVAEIAKRSGRTAHVAVVTGDDITKAFHSARSLGWDPTHLDTGLPFSALNTEAVVVNAYLGGWGITEALAAGADVVITGRVTDAAVILGPAAWHFGWARDDWDALAGAIAAGHVIECGAQATGGNYAFFGEVPSLAHVGFPIADIKPDGSAVITKHPGTDGVVCVETVTAQLLYEIDGPRYANPDVICRLDTAQLRQVGPDRVEIFGVRGEPAPEAIKAGVLVSGGWRNETTFVLTGLDIESKAEQALTALWDMVPGGEKAFDDVATRVLRCDRPDPSSMAEAVALLTVAVRGRERALVNALPRYAVETGLASYPGLYFTSPPATATEVSVFWPTLVAREMVSPQVSLGPATWKSLMAQGQAVHSRPPAVTMSDAVPVTGPTRRVPLGKVLGARSGDKAGNATLGVWARSDAAHAWLRSWWSAARIGQLLPEAAGCDIRTWELPLLRACGATIVGLLGEGVAANLQMDSQAKGLGEYLRAKHIDVPIELLETGS
jgi:hypothetical protein